MGEFLEICKPCFRPPPNIQIAAHLLGFDLMHDKRRAALQQCNKGRVSVRYFTDEGNMCRVKII